MPTTTPAISSAGMIRTADFDQNPVWTPSSYEPITATTETPTAGDGYTCVAYTFGPLTRKFLETAWVHTCDRPDGGRKSG